MGLRGRQNQHHLSLSDDPGLRMFVGSWPASGVGVDTSFCFWLNELDQSVASKDPRPLGPSGIDSLTGALPRGAEAQHSEEKHS